MKGLTGHWSKWGGRVYDVLDNQFTEVREYWYCQSCNQPIPVSLSPYKYEYPQGDYIRVCAVCLADGCRILHVRVSESL